ncbi:hypothetical protein [Chamaesiphon polymorphus]|nr:hypothetical protein [Chamaesiphon polymorphus]
MTENLSIPQGGRSASLQKIDLHYKAPIQRSKNNLNQAIGS